MYIYIYIYREREREREREKSLNIIKYIAEAKVFNIVFAVSTGAIFRIHFFLFSFKTESEFVFRHTSGIVSQILRQRKMSYEYNNFQI